MTIAEIQKYISLFGGIGAGALIGGVITYFFVKSFLPSYISELSKNFAKKRDLEVITDMVESVKLDYAKILEEYRSENQLKFSSIEREKNIKKEVFLNAIEAISRYHNIIARYPDLEISNKEISEEMRINDGIISRVDIVGNQETVSAVNNVTTSVGTTAMELFLEREKLLRIKDDIEFREGLRESNNKELNRYLDIMKTLNLQGNNEENVWNVINRQVEFEKKSRDALNIEINQLWIEKTNKHFEFTELCMKRFFTISSEIPQCVLSIRKELDMELSDIEYRKIISERISKGEKVFSEFLENIKQIQADDLIQLTEKTERT